LEYGVPPILGIVIILLLRRLIQTQKDRKLQNLDEADINGLAFESKLSPDDAVGRSCSLIVETILSE
jgi:hypothetical protein